MALFESLSLQIYNNLDISPVFDMKSCINYQENSKFESCIIDRDIIKANITCKCPLYLLIWVYVLYYLYIPGSEEELSVEIRFFNNIHISDPHSTTFPTAEPHHSPVLQHLTTNSSSSNLQLSRTFITCSFTHISMKIIVVVLIRRISVPTTYCL